MAQNIFNIVIYCSFTFIILEPIIDLIKIGRAIQMKKKFKEGDLVEYNCDGEQITGKYTPEKGMEGFTLMVQNTTHEIDFDLEDHLYLTRKATNQAEI